MKLSVIVPVYNVEKYLAECVDSLLNQTLMDMEIILVDDGSKDSSGAICDHYAAENPGKVKCLHIDNGGQGRARNFALPMAQGEYLGFVDSDDWVLPDMYEKLCSRADETGADIVTCDFLECFDDGTEREVPGAFQDHPLSFAGSCCNKVFRASLVKDLRFPEERLWYEDFYFSAVMLIRAKDTEYLREPLYIYRRGQPSVQIVHKCRNGRSYKVTFWGPDQTANQNDTIYRWNEANAGDNPNWWPERYDYLHGLCRGASPRGEAGV